MIATRQKFVLNARDVVRELQPRIVDTSRAPSRDFSRKFDGSLVTEIDDAVEEALTNRFRQVFPEAPIIAEEAEARLSQWTASEGVAYYAKVLSAPFSIAIDPIDGTKNFVEGSSEFCVSAALLESCAEGVWPTAAVIAIPRAGEMYWRDDAGVFVECLVSGTVREVQRQSVEGDVISVSVKDKIWLSERGFLTKGQVITSGSSVHDFLSTALGRLRASVIGKQRIWDFMGALSIADALGLTLKDLETGEEIHGFAPSDFTPEVDRRPWGVVRKMMILAPNETPSQFFSKRAITS